MLTDRVFKARDGLALSRLRGLEIGALDRPMVTRADGPIIYVDHVNTAGLVAKYGADPGVDTAAIVDVDAVWAGGRLHDALGGRAPVDYAIASHVVEHVPDLVGWVAQLHEVIRPDGELRLIVPDRRYTFDRARRETSLADVLAAHVTKPMRPGAQAILDYALNIAFVDIVEAWDGTYDDAQPKLRHTAAEALAWAVDATENGTYRDVHCWVFTPRGFLALFGELAALGLMPFACAAFADTEHYQFDFYVRLTPCADAAVAAASWAAMGRQMDEVSPGV